MAACLALPGAVGAAGLEVTVTGSDGTPLADAVVWVDSTAARAAARPMAGVEVVQRDKAFVPAVSVVTVGTAVAFPNRDTVRHHVYSFSPAKRFEIKLYVGTPAAPVVFDRPGVAVLGCNIHDQMAAWIVILETPWFARTDARGRASLPDVPPGRHQLRTWHVDLPVGAPALAQALERRAGPQSATVRVVP
jgi:plastocyanin